MWRMCLDLFILLLVIIINLLYTDFRNFSLEGRIIGACFFSAGFVYLLLSKPWKKQSNAFKDGGITGGYLDGGLVTPRLCIGCKYVMVKLNNYRGSAASVSEACEVCGSVWMKHQVSQEENQKKQNIKNCSAKNTPRF